MSQNKYECEPIPRNSDGDIVFEEYRERIWYMVHSIGNQMERINGTVDEHSRDIGFIKTVHKVMLGLLLIAGTVTGIIHKIGG